MQATSMKRFVIGHSGAAIVTLGILTAAVTGVIALTLDNDLAGNQTAESAHVMPQAYVSAGQGEGLVDASAGVSAATTMWARAFVSPSQGEGSVDSTNNAVATGRFQAQTSLGQGEGFVGPGAIVDSRLLVGNSHNAYWSFGQGEGLVDATYQRPEPRAKAYSHPEHGEGLVDPRN